MIFRSSLFFSALFISIFVLTSCRKEKSDNNAPSIKVNASTETIDTLFAGAELPIELLLVDNEALSHLTVEIHHLENEYNHTLVTVSSYWEHNEQIQLSGNAQTILRQIQIPTNAAAGKYQVILKCFDKEGNGSEKIEQEFVLLNPGDLTRPEIEIIIPAINCTFSAGSQLPLRLEISDNEQLSRVEIIARNSNTIPYIWIRETDAVTLFVYNFISTEGWPTGTYTVKLRAYDNVLNYTESIINLNLI